MKNPKARVIAYYLPQFHPIPENDYWWGPGFTEWTNVANAKPLFKGHYQPRIPADLGFYDLRLPQVRKAQADMARSVGIEGFCYWHYWLGGGKELLEMPFNEVLRSGEPDFPFCLAWANHSWSTKTWQNTTKKGNSQQTMIAKQLYLGEDDYIQHFYSLLPAFKDKRYMTIDGKPIFVIYDPFDMGNECMHFMSLWRDLAKKNGLAGIYFIGHLLNTTVVQSHMLMDNSHKKRYPHSKNYKQAYENLLTSYGFDAIQPKGQMRAECATYGDTYVSIRKRLQSRFPWLPTIKFSYPKVMQHFYVPEDRCTNVFPTILSGWDRSPRAGNAEAVYIDYTPESFKRHVCQGIEIVKDKPLEHRVLFLKSWNEWGEGNYLEPDRKYGHAFLNVLRDSLFDE